MDKLFPVFYFLGLPLVFSMVLLLILNLTFIRDDSIQGFKIALRKTLMQGIGALVFAVSMFFLHSQAFWPR